MCRETSRYVNNGVMIKNNYVVASPSTRDSVTSRISLVRIIFRALNTDQHLSNNQVRFPKCVICIISKSKIEQAGSINLISIFSEI